MKNLPSGLPLAAAIATLGCIALLLFVAPAAQAQQSQEIEAELEARLRAELQQQMRAELQQQIEAELQQRRRAGMQQIQALNDRLVEQAGAMERRRVEEMRRYEEALARAGQELRRQGRSTRVFRMRGHCDDFGETVLDFTDEFELTDDQAAQIREAQRTVRRAAIQRNADLEVGAMDLDALYEVETPDLTAIRAKLEELAILNVDQQMAGLHLREQVRAVLSDAQRQKLEEMQHSDDLVFSVTSSLGIRHIAC